MAVRVNAENFAAEVLQAYGIVLVDFYSDSCVSMQADCPFAFRGCSSLSGGIQSSKGEYQL